MCLIRHSTIREKTKTTSKQQIKQNKQKTNKNKQTKNELKQKGQDGGKGFEWLSKVKRKKTNSGVFL